MLAYPRRMTLAFLAVSGGLGMAAETDAQAILERFSKAWPESRNPYRTDGDETWKEYVLATRDLVACGAKAVPVLIQAAGHENFQVRSLAARVLGWLGDAKAVPALIGLLDDPRKEVHVPAADALGQIQTPEGKAALERHAAKQTKGDVALHLQRSLERFEKELALEDDVARMCLRISKETLGLAAVGHAAPVFSLKDAAGTEWSLEERRGKRQVLLIFLYGDG